MKEQGLSLLLKLAIAAAVVLAFADYLQVVK